MEVGTGTTDASMDEWLEVCSLYLIAAKIQLPSFFSHTSSFSSMSITLLLMIQIKFKTAHCLFHRVQPILSPNPTNQRRRSR